MAADPCRSCVVLAEQEQRRAEGEDVKPQKIAEISTSSRSPSTTILSLFGYVQLPPTVTVSENLLLVSSDSVTSASSSSDSSTVWVPAPM